MPLWEPFQYVKSTVVSLLGSGNSYKIDEALHCRLQWKILSCPSFYLTLSHYPIITAINYLQPHKHYFIVFDLKQNALDTNHTPVFFASSWRWSTRHWPIDWKKPQHFFCRPSWGKLLCGRGFQQPSSCAVKWFQEQLSEIVSTLRQPHILKCTQMQS